MLDKFLSEIKKSGLSKPYLFKVEIVFPQQIRNGVSQDMFKRYGITPRDVEKISLFCEATELPGRNIQTNPIKTHGSPIKVPYNAIFDDVPMTFYVDKDMTEKKFFDAWQRMVVNPFTGDLNYYNEYTTTIRIIQLTEDGNSTYAIKLKNAYPVTISPMGLGHAETNQIARIPVNFAYHTWEYIPQNQLGQSQSLGSLLLNNGMISNKINSKIFELKQMGNQITNEYRIVKDYLNYFNNFI